MSATLTPEQKEAKVAALNAQLNGNRVQQPDMAPGTTVDSLIAKEDAKVDITKLKLWKDAEEQGGKAAEDPNKPALVDPDAPAPVPGVKLQGTKETPKTEEKKPLKERTKDWEALARRQQAKFLADNKARSDAESARAEAARFKEQNDRTLTLLEQAQKNPIDWLAKQGVTAVQLAKAAVTQGKTPEQTAQNALEAKVNEVLAENKRLKDEQAQRQQQAEATAQFAREKAAFVDAFKEGGETKYPALTKVLDNPEQIVDEFLGFVNTLRANETTAAELRRAPELYTDEVLLSIFEKKTAKLIAKLTTTQDPAGNKTAPQTTQTTPNHKPGKIATKAASKQLALPKDFDRLPEADQRRLLIEYAAKYAIKTE
jgi:hypothetical protein